MNMDTNLPPTRIKTIMKSSLETGQISNDTLLLVTKSAEMFIKHLSKQAYEYVGHGNNTLKYEHLAKCVNDSDNLEFLLQIVPQKISVREFKKRLDMHDDESDDESSTDEEDGSGKE